MKELEALLVLKANRNQSYERVNEAFETIEKALTPPTSEEVCREIEESYCSNITEMGVIYDSINKAFRVGKTYNCICEYDEYEKKINYHWIVTPELSIFIGRFYQGVKE